MLGVEKTSAQGFLVYIKEVTWCKQVHTTHGRCHTIQFCLQKWSVCCFQSSLGTSHQILCLLSIPLKTFKLFSHSVMTNYGANSTLIIWSLVICKCKSFRYVHIYIYDLLKIFQKKPSTSGFCPPPFGSVGRVPDLRTGCRWFDPWLGQYSFRWLMIVIAAGFIPLSHQSPLSIFSTMVMWESSQWLGKNIM